MRIRISVVVAAIVTCILPVQQLNGQMATRRGATVYFVPVGVDESLSRLQNTAEWFREALGLDIIVTDRIEPRADTLDRTRAQFVGERLVEQLADLRHQRLPVKSAAVIGITDADIYMAGYAQWLFVFSYRRVPAAAALVSYARMDPRNLGQRDNEDLLQARLRKIVTKDIGILVYGRNMTADPRSLLYSRILGVDDLDRIEEDFNRAGIAPMRRP